MVAVSYKPFSVPSMYFEKNARRKNGREAQRKDRTSNGWQLDASFIAGIELFVDGGTVQV
jgi:hypothetical protein